MANYTWRVADGAFDVAADWVNTSIGEVPASTVPGPADTANFSSGGGTIGGTGSVAALNFDPGSSWAVSGRISGGSIVVNDDSAIAPGGTLTVSAGTLAIASDADAAGSLTVNAGATLNSSVSPQSGRYVLDVGGFAASTGATGTLTVQGAGASVDLNGNAAAVGLAGTGTLNVIGGGTVRFGSPDPAHGTASLAVGRGGQGLVNVSGSSSALLLSGAMYAGRASGSSGVVDVANGGLLVETASGAGGLSSFGDSGTIDGALALGGVGQLNVTAGGVASFADALGFGGSGSSGAGFISGPGSVLAVGGVLRVGYGTAAPGGTGTLTVSGGAVVQSTVAADTANSSVSVADAAGTSGTITVDGTGSLLDSGPNGGSIGDAGTGELAVVNGGSVTFRSGDSRARAALAAGSGSGAVATIGVSGTGSSVYAAGFVSLGRAGTAALSVDRGGSFTGGSAGTGANASFAVVIGDGTPSLDASGNPNATLLYGGQGSAAITGSSLLHSLGALRIGDHGSTGTLLVDGGSVAQGDLAVVVGGGADRPGARGTVTVANGSSLLGGGLHALGAAGIALGTDSGTTGSVSVTGAGSTLNANGDRLTVGAAGTGTLSVTAGAQAQAGALYADAEAALAIGALSGGAGAIGVDGAGSRLLVAGAAVLGGTDAGAGVAAGGTGQLSLTNGALLQTGAMTLFAGSGLGLDAASQASVGGDLTNLGAISSNGRLTVAGAVAGSGALTLGGGFSEFGALGGITVSLGGSATTLRLHGLSGANTLSAMQPGDTVDLAGLTGLSIGSGNTIAAGSGTLALAAAPSGYGYTLLGDANGGTDLVLTATTPPANAIALTNVSTGTPAVTATGDAYAGGADYLQRQYIHSGADSVAIRANVANAFLRGGSGNDALQVVAGNNVLDGGLGSNFLVGGSGADGGRDTFVLDGRGGFATWSTLVNFHRGDTAQILGFHGSGSTLAFTASEGVGLYKGGTIHSELNGPGTGVDESLTFAGLDQATVQAFRYTPVTPSSSTGPASGQDYLLIQYV